VYTTERESELYLVVSGIFEYLPGIFIGTADKLRYLSNLHLWIALLAMILLLVSGT
jgi:hypothetical protein